MDVYQRVLACLSVWLAVLIKTRQDTAYTLPAAACRLHAACAWLVQRVLVCLAVPPHRARGRAYGHMGGSDASGLFVAVRA